MSRRALLAWEGGAGRGHILTLKSVAEAIGDRFGFDAVLCRMDHAAELAPVCQKVLPVPGFPYTRKHRTGPGAVATSTWGEFLGDLGFRDAGFLSRRIAWWQERMRERDISLLVADFAPCALLAARGLGIAATAVGVGYSVPPFRMREFPILLPDMPQRIYDEGDIVDVVNEAGGPLGVPPITAFPEVYRCDAQLVRTLPMLDPYFAERTEPLLPPLTDVAAGFAGNGTEIFAYFSTTESKDADLMEAICDLGTPTRIHMPGISGDLADRLSSRGVIIERAPVPVDVLVARTRLMIHAGQHGILCLGLAAGLPQIAVPQHLEQLYHARQAASAGVLRLVSKAERRPATFRAIVGECCKDRKMAVRALALAQELHPHFSGDARGIMRGRLASY